MAGPVKTMIAEPLPYFIVRDVVCLMDNSAAVDYHDAKEGIF